MAFMREIQYQPGHKIFLKDDAGESFFIVKSGVIDIYIDEVNIVRTITSGNYFGERALLMNDLRSATAKARELSTCWVLQKNDFLRNVD
mmetsp:Transcript_6728/g.848  ORF Transcript_6728/g.848 Transcript_6728/m.848 type:complete len:89 (+) Transcript_6728:802-1068(+)